MQVERLTSRHISPTDECFDNSPPVGSLDQIADELGDGDTALACPFGNGGGYIVRQVDDQGYGSQRIHRRPGTVRRNHR